MALGQAAAGSVVLLGVAVLFYAWRGRARGGGAGRWRVGAGWGLIGSGLLGWSLSTSPDVGLALAVLVAMSAALVLIAGRALFTARALKPMRRPPKPKDEDDRLVLGPGYWRRAGFRVFGAVVAAPAAAACAGLAWCVYGPGAEADRLMGMVLATVLVMAVGLVFLLASRRPARAVTTLLVLGLLALSGALGPQVAQALS